jgi:lysozyme family protein
MLDRRSFTGLVLAAFGYSALSIRAGWAQDSGWTRGAQPIDSAIASLRERAAAAGVGSPRLAAEPIAGTDYDMLLPHLIDLLDEIETARSEARTQSDALDKLASDAGELLGALVAAERSPATDDEERAAPYRYEDLRDDYLAKYDSCLIRPERAGIVDWHLKVLLKPANRTRYEAVEKLTKVPWYFVGITHSLEAGFNFQAHLHNGDPLRGRTFQVPAGRPKQWNPPNDWSSSAADALTLKKYDHQPDWTLGQLLFRFEQYNGFGYRPRAVPTPYLWSFSNHYTKGKYVADGKWNSDAVSKQCGAGLLVKELANRGIIAPPTRA